LCLCTLTGKEARLAKTKGKQDWVLQYGNTKIHSSTSSVKILLITFSTVLNGGKIYGT
jgi:hypothetical protein